MSNYNDNSWSDKFSWVITVIAMVLVAILSTETAYVYSIPDGDAIQDDLEVKYE